MHGTTAVANGTIYIAADPSCSLSIATSPLPRWTPDDQHALNEYMGSSGALVLIPEDPTHSYHKHDERPCPHAEIVNGTATPKNLVLVKSETHCSPQLHNGAHVRLTGISEAVYRQQRA